MVLPPYYTVELLILVKILNIRFHIVHLYSTSEINDPISSESEWTVPVLWMRRFSVTGSSGLRWRHSAVGLKAAKRLVDIHFLCEPACFGGECCHERWRCVVGIRKKLKSKGLCGYELWSNSNTSKWKVELHRMLTNATAPINMLLGQSVSNLKVVT